MTSIANLATKGEITISNAVEGSGTAKSKEKVKIKGQTSKEKVTLKGSTSKEKVKFKTEVKEAVKCGNTESKGGAVTCDYSDGNATATEPPAKEFGESLKNPVIDAAILSTKHSWGVDNYSCGGELGDITIWGSIAENFRGRVTCCASGGIYIKDYKYDERLKTLQPPDFLTPSSSEVKLSRVTEAPASLGEA